MVLAPIVLFVYRRPEHTLKVLEALRQNPEASATELTIFSDGPKNESDRSDVMAVRNICKKVDGFARCSLVERDENWGLARSVIAGVSHVCEACGRVIVLEDDHIVSPHFLSYMNVALDRYADDARVMQISAHAYPVAWEAEDEAAFFCMPDSWGWATWQRAWALFDPNMLDYERLRVDPALRKAFDLDDSYPFFDMLEAQRKGVVDSWAIRWWLTIFMHDGLNLVPFRSMVHNIGFDGTGTHCPDGEAMDGEAITSPVRRFPSVVLNMKQFAHVRNYLATHAPSPPPQRRKKPLKTFERWIRHLMRFTLEKIIIMLREIAFYKAARNPKWSKYYYCFFDDLFSNEHELMIQARFAFFNKNGCMAKDCLLNRNIHRIEKALAVPNRKRVFGESYIEETVVLFEEMYIQQHDKLQLKWAYNVLEEYFNQVKHVPAIEQAYFRYRNVEKVPDSISSEFLPVAFSEIKKSNINIHEYQQFCSQRRSVRWYADKSLNSEDIKKCAQIALTAPSACNRQAFRFEYIDKPEYIKMLKSLPSGTDVFADNIVAMMFIIGDMSVYGNGGGRHLLYIDVGLASMTLMQALESMGISSCPLNWPDLADREKRLMKLLNLEAYEKCIMALSIGYPLETGKVTKSQRRDIETVWSYNNVHTT